MDACLEIVKEVCRFGEQSSLMRAFLLLLMLVLPLRSSTLSDARRVVLQGVANARQLGGIPVRGGKVREGWVFRTNSLYRLSDGDEAILRSLGVRSVIDFRLDWDRKKHPDRPDYLASLDHYFWLPMTLNTTPEGYRKMPDEYSEQIRELFHIFAGAENYPLLYHCAEGKDRTGIASALLLELLGADRAQIVDDYMASQANGSRFHVEEAWIRGLFEGIDAAGGIENYLDLHGVSLLDRDAIRHLLIVP